MEVTRSVLRHVQLTIPGHLTPAQMGGMWGVWSETLFCGNLNFPWERVDFDKITLVLLWAAIHFLSFPGTLAGS